MIKKVGDEWVLFTKDGKKVLYRAKTKKEILKREKVINFFKNKKKGEWK